MKTNIVVCTCIMIMLLPVEFIWATLGEAVLLKNSVLDAGSVSQKTGVGEKYTTYEYQQNGNTVKEFASVEGVVFAVSWRGISKPDLKALFGAYLEEYFEALNEVPKQYGHKTVSMKTTKMVIRRGGRMRDQRGFVYVPSLVPEGVNVEQLP